MTAVRIHSILAVLLLAAAGLAAEPGKITWEEQTLALPDGPALPVALGRLAVPESSERPQGRTVELAFLRLPAVAGAAGAPIVFLSGGPGGSGVAAARGSLQPFFLALREAGDVFALDPRGSGLSRPTLACRESWTLPFDHPTRRGELLDLARGRSAACAAMLREEGVDLSAYDTEQMADDLEALRRALGVPRLRLVATSYGTELALAALRRHEGSFERAALFGVQAPHQHLRLPAETERRLAGIDARVAADPAARQGLPGGFLATLRTVLGRLEREPAAADVDLALAGRPQRVVVGAFDLQLAVAQALSTRAGAARLPAQVRAYAAGDFRSLARFAYGVRRGWLGSAMPYCVDCASGVPAERRAAVERQEKNALLGRALDFPFPEICDAWGVPDLGEAYRKPVTSRLPVLFVSGSEDVRTPAANAAQVLRGFPNGRELLVRGAGHGDDLFLSSPRIAAEAVRFLQGKRPTARTLDLPPLAFAGEP